MTFKQGDIVIADFPFTSMTGFKKRPCVVLAQSDSAKIMTLNTALIAGKIGELPSDLLNTLKEKLTALLL